MRLLIADIVWRMRWKAAAFAALFAVMFGTSAASGDVARAFGASMGAAFAIGMMTFRLNPRPVWYLPISRRDVWRAEWLIATVGVTLLTTAIKVAALPLPYISDSLGLGSVALSSLYDFAYIGAGCGLVVFTTRAQPTSGPWRPVSTFLKGVAEFALAGGYLLAIYGGFPLGRVLPTRWTDLTARSATVLVAALALAVATYFHTPATPAPSNRPLPQPRIRSGTQRLDPGGLLGLPRLLLHEAVWTLMVGGALVGGSAGFVLVTAGIAQSSESPLGILRTTLLRLDQHARPEPGGGFDALILLMAFAVFAATLAARFPSMMRHLRVLPLGAARLNALLIAWPAAIWLTAWMGLQALRYVSLGRIDVFSQSDALVALIGISAIVQAMSLRLSGFVRFLAFASLLVLVPLLLFLGAPPPAVSVTVGLGGLGLAAMLNRRSLARRPTYAPVGPAVAGAQLC